MQDVKPSAGINVDDLVGKALPGYPLLQVNLIIVAFPNICAIKEKYILYKNILRSLFYRDVDHSNKT